MGQIFSHPATIIVVILLIVLLFGAPKLPGMARSLGQSMRIFKTEVEGLKNDSMKDPREKDGEEVVTAEVVDICKSSKTESKERSRPYAPNPCQPTGRHGFCGTTP